MNATQKLALLFIITTLASCNEKITPELQDANTTNGGNTTTVVPPKEYSFKITNTSPLLLNYKLHRTGASNSSFEFNAFEAPCEVNLGSTQLSNTIFRAGNPSNPKNHTDISCYLEAEELSLFHGGFSFAIEASPNTCDYIGYSPFSFFSRMPGDSSTSLTRVSCETDTTTSAVVAAEPTAPRDLNGPIGCNQIVDDTIATVDDDNDPATPEVEVRKSFTVTSDADLCRFNYKQQNTEAATACDIGIITIREFKVSHTPATDTDPAVVKVTEDYKEIDCGGQIKNCVAGPITKSSLWDGETRITEIAQAELNKAYKQNVSYEGLMGKNTTNRQYANFRRTLANPNMDYQNGTLFTTGYSNTYKNAFQNIANRSNYFARLMDLYSSNLRWDALTPMISQSEYEFHQLRYDSAGNPLQRAVPLAAEPFLGVDPGQYSGSAVTKSINGTSPFYMFYCFDTAFDIKARIRMVVRDWDRVFGSNSELELISDIFNNSSARQDIPQAVEVPGDGDGFILFNDRLDWDDTIPMQRTSGGLSASGTVWSPVPFPSSNGSLNFPFGFFRPSYFPNSTKY
jgi:hypothetical protein